MSLNKTLVETKMCTFTLESIRMGYPIIELSGRSNLAGQSLEDFFSNNVILPNLHNFLCYDKQILLILL